MIKIIDFTKYKVAEISCWQYDYGQLVQLIFPENLSNLQVQWNHEDGFIDPRIIYEEAGLFFAKIPNKGLEKPNSFVGYVYKMEEEFGQTLFQIKVKVRVRPPIEESITEDELSVWQQLIIDTINAKEQALTVPDLIWNSFNGSESERNSIFQQSEEDRNFWESWSPEHFYKLGNKVEYEGSSYVALEDNYGVIPPENISFWQLIAAKGEQGDPGDAATVAVGKVTTLDAGESATVANSGTSGAAVLDFGLPQGDVGPQGPQGVQGSQGVQGPQGEIGPKGDTGASIVSANFADDDIVFAKDDATTVVLADAAVTLKGDQGIQGEIGPQGIQGDTGPKGDKGDAGEMTIGTVTTLAPGEPATVTNTGTSTDAVLDIAIPAGYDGSAVPIDDASTAADRVLSASYIKGQLAEKVPLTRQTKYWNRPAAYRIQVAAGRFNMSWNNANGRRWVFPAGTVLYSDGTTPIRTSTDEKPDVTIPAGGGYVWLVSAMWNGLYSLSANDTNTVLIGSLADLPPLTSFLSLSNCSNVTGSLADLPPVTYTLNLSNCSNVTGSYSAVNGTNVPTTTTLTNTGLSAADMDATLIAYAACTKDNGTFTATGKTRTAASDAAVATLTGRGWTISGITKV